MEKGMSPYSRLKDKSLYDTHKERHRSTIKILLLTRTIYLQQKGGSIYRTIKEDPD